jgi:hypothetical protein
MGAGERMLRMGEEWQNSKSEYRNPKQIQSKNSKAQKIQRLKTPVLDFGPFVF